MKEIENINFDSLASTVKEKKEIYKVDIRDIYKRKKEKYEFLKANNWMLGPTTPFEEIDKLTKGFKKGGLVGIGAYSNTGKSQLSYYYAQHFLKQGLEVAYFSLEVSSEDVLIMINQYYHGESYKQSAAKPYHEGVNKLNIYDVSEYYHLSDIESYVIEYKPDVVFIDFIQILEMEGSTEYDKLNSGIRRLQRLAIETETTIIYLSQVSNDDAKQENVLNVGLKGSGNLIASSDYVFIMKKGNMHGEVVFGLKKNKHGPAWKKFALNFDFENGKCNYDGEHIEEEDNNKYKF